VSGWLVRNLRTVAIIGQYVRPEDLAVRHGGDEFAVVLEQPVPLDEPALQRAVALRHRLQDHDWGATAPGLSVRASVGVAVGELSDGAEVLYQRADVALYAAKQSTDGVVLADALGRDGRPPSDADRRGRPACERPAGG